MREGRKKIAITIGFMVVLIVGLTMWGVQTLKQTPSETVKQATKLKQEHRRPQLNDGDVLESKSNAVTVTVE